MLKLAGTTYFPNVKHKILFLESYSGDENRIRAYFAQLYMMHVLQDAEHIILGQFSELSKKGQLTVLKNIMVEYHISYTQIDCVGHSCDSMAMWIGGKS